MALPLLAEGEGATKLNELNPGVIHTVTLS
jgi:hypothetical protein